MLIHGDCLEVMAGMEPESVDSIVTDPPYNLVSIGKRFGKEGSAPIKDDNFGGRYTRLARGFMGQEWDGDGIAFKRETWEAAYRVAKPSSYLLAFGGTRTVHRMTCALEDAGWIIRDMLVWAYASGFPKSKASLKPAWEPIVMARKPGPLRMLAIDECRIEFEAGGDAASNPAYRTNNGYKQRAGTTNSMFLGTTEKEMPAHPLGRWPANVILTDPIFDGGIEGVVGGGEARAAGEYVKGSVGFDADTGNRGVAPFGVDGLTSATYGDTGTYSRFFLVPKSSRSDREPVLGGLVVERDMNGSPVRNARCTKCGRVKFAAADARCDCGDPEWVASSTGRANVHPTVKPTELMRHLVRLVTPTGGIVLDPFLGSGTTALAAEMEGFEWIGIEREAEYCAIAEARLNGTQRGLGLPA